MANLADVIRYNIYLSDDLDWDEAKATAVDMYPRNAKLFVTITDTRFKDKFVTGVDEFMPIGVGLFIFYKPANPFTVSDLITGDPVEGGGCGDTEDSEAGGNLGYFMNL